MDNRNTPGRSFFFILTALFIASQSLTGCGGDSDSSGGAAGVSGTAGAGTGGSGGGGGASINPNAGSNFSYLRWQLSRTGTTVSSLSLETIRSSASLIPHANGDYLVIVFSGDQKIAAYPFKFPNTYIVEKWGEGGSVNHQEGILNGTLLTSINIPFTETITKLQIMDAAGTIVAETTQLSDGTSLQSINPTLSNNQSGLEAVPGYPGIHFLTAGEYVNFLDQTLNAISGSQRYLLITPPDEWKRIVIDELSRVSPRALSGVTHFGFASLPLEVDAITTGSIIIINTNAINYDPVRAGTIVSFRTGFVVHEVAHAYQSLLDEYDSIFSSTARGHRWTAETRALAELTMSRLHLNSDFEDFWEEIHEEGVDEGISISYLGDRWQTLSNAAAVQKGFAYNYGASRSKEDIATLVEYIQSAPIRGRSSLCLLIGSARDPETLAQVSLPYIKINLLKVAGFITEEAMENCIQGTSLRGERGIFLYKPDGNRDSLDIVNAGYLTDNGHDYLIVSGARSAYSIQFRVKTDGRSVPLGIGLHRVADVYSLDDHQNAVLLGNSEEGLRSRTSRSGYILISTVNSNPPRVEGGVFFLKLKNPVGVTTDNYIYGTFLYTP